MLKFAEPMSDDEMAALLEEQGRVQDAIDKADAWDMDRKLDVAMDARMDEVYSAGYHWNGEMWQATQALEVGPPQALRAGAPFDLLVGNAFDACGERLAPSLARARMPGRNARTQ